HGGQLRSAVDDEAHGCGYSETGCRFAAFQRRQLVTGEMGTQHRQMGREGSGCGARFGAAGESGDTAFGAGRSADEGHESGKDEGAAGMIANSLRKRIAVAAAVIAAIG